PTAWSVVVAMTIVGAPNAPLAVARAATCTDDSRPPYNERPSGLGSSAEKSGDSSPGIDTPIANVDEVSLRVNISGGPGREKVVLYATSSSLAIATLAPTVP